MTKSIEIDTWNEKISIVQAIDNELERLHDRLSDKKPFRPGDAHEQIVKLQKILMNIAVFYFGEQIFTERFFS